MIKVIVTGGCGFIGGHLVDGLVALGFDVHIVDIRKPDFRNDGATYHNQDIRDTGGLLKLFKGVTYVFHLAALPRVQYSIQNPQETNETNITGTLNVLEASRLCGVKRVIYSTSSSVYGNQPIPFIETMGACPMSPYGLQKYVGEEYCRLWSLIYGLETVSLRYFNVYGPRYRADDSLVIGKFLLQKQEGKPLTITGDGEQTRDFTHVQDVVHANLLAMLSIGVGNGEVINIGAGNPVSINKLADIIGGEKQYIPERIEPRATHADNSLAYELLGWKPQITITDGLKELL